MKPKRRKKCFKFQVSSFKKDAGFTILETTVAIFILVVAIVAAISAFYGITLTTSSISSRLTAAYLAQEGIEIIRNIRDTNWLNNPTDPTKWDNGLDICKTFNGCEADYTTGTGEGGTPFEGYDGITTLNIDNDKFYSYKITGITTPTKFKRQIKVTALPDGYTLDVSVLVEWEEKGEHPNFTAEEQLYNWH